MSGGGCHRLARIVVCALGGLLLAQGAQAVTPSKPTLLGAECRGCHGLPPGSGEEEGPFKPGAHAEHREISCERCHTSGLEPSHIDGIIALRPELEYQYGPSVPWPSVGSGSCGGRGRPFQPTACHQAMPQAKCFWIPGKSCREEGERN